MFSDDIAIDLGTANTLVHVAGRGIVVDEPSLVAVRMHGAVREVLAVGAAARALLGKAPEKLDAIRPLKDGVIADDAAAREMLRQFLDRTKTTFGLRRPRVLVSVPAAATPVDRRIIVETIDQVGARKILMVEEPVAAAVGAGLQISGPDAQMVIDIGGGTTDIAVLVHGRVVQSRSLRTAGNAMDEAIVRYVHRQHRLVIGEGNAERIKIAAGSADPETARRAQIKLRGRNVDTGAETVVTLTPRDIAKALGPTVEEIADFVERALADLAAALPAENTRRKIFVSGGGGQLQGLDRVLHQRLGLPITLTETPMQCVVNGSATMLAHLRLYRHLLIDP